MRAIHTLLHNSIDYAGLFPPAGLDMESAVTNYASYQAGATSWALGRLVLPADRLAQFERAARPRVAATAGAGPWRLSTLLGADLVSDLAAIADFNQRHASTGDALIDSVEVKANSIAAAESTMDHIPEALQAYIEIPIGGDLSGLIASIARRRRRAKVRTGGVTRDAFPEPAELIRFMTACTGAGVAFKATAGLHHCLRAEYPLTYAPDSPRGLMFGFLNLFLAAAFLRAGMDQRTAEQVLEERSLDAVRAEDEAIHWHNHRLGLADVRRARQEVIVSFGSCSFTEPLQELQTLHLLDSRVQQT